MEDTASDISGIECTTPVVRISRAGCALGAGLIGDRFGLTGVSSAPGMGEKHNIYQGLTIIFRSVGVQLRARNLVSEVNETLKRN